MLHIEANVEDLATTVNNLIDAHDDQVDDQKWIKDKLADIEDRSRHNNIKICGISETVQALELPSYVRSMIKTLLPDQKNIEMVIDQIHRLPNLHSCLIRHQGM